MPKYRGYTRDYLQETLIDIPRREEAQRKAQEQAKLEEGEQAKIPLSMTERINRMRET